MVRAVMADAVAPIAWTSALMAGSCLNLLHTVLHVTTLPAELRRAITRTTFRAMFLYLAAIPIAFVAIVVPHPLLAALTILCFLAAQWTMFGILIHVREAWTTPRPAPAPAPLIMHPDGHLCAEDCDEVIEVPLKRRLDADETPQEGREAP
jgi:hypothetical protein